MELKSAITNNKANLEDLAEIDWTLNNIDAEVARYLDNNSQLRVEYLLEHLEKIVIYPDKAIVIIPILCEGFVVDKTQYVSKEKSTKIQTESNIIYLADVRYWNRKIGLYIQFVAA